MQKICERRSYAGIAGRLPVQKLCERGTQIYADIVTKHLRAWNLDKTNMGSHVEKYNGKIPAPP